MKTRKTIQSLVTIRWGVLLACVVLGLAHASCERRETYYQYQELKDKVWSKDSILIFNIDSGVVEEGVAYDIILEVDNSVDYPYQNLWLFLEHNFRKDSTKAFVEKEFVLADKMGKWYGQGAAFSYSLSMPFIYQYVFRDQRNYYLAIQHGMRDRPLVGISRIGLRIEKSGK